MSAEWQIGPRHRAAADARHTPLPYVAMPTAGSYGNVYVMTSVVERVETLEIHLTIAHSYLLV